MARRQYSVLREGVYQWNREIKKINWKAIKGLKGTLPPQLGLLALLEEIDVEKTAVSGTLSHSLFSAASGIEKAPARPVRGPPAHTLHSHSRLYTSHSISGGATKSRWRPSPGSL